MNAAISLVKPYMLVLVNIFSGTAQRRVLQCLLQCIGLAVRSLRISLRSYYSILPAHFSLNSLFEIQLYSFVLYCVNCPISRAWFVQFMQRANFYSLMRVEEVVTGLSGMGLGTWKSNCPCAGRYLRNNGIYCRL